MVFYQWISVKSHGNKLTNTILQNFKEKIVNVIKQKDEKFVITSDNESSIRAKKVILAVGYYDVYPDIPGFIECWGDTIISCPFCDGYENRMVFGVLL